VGKTIVDALGDPKLFGSLPPFKDLASWRKWIVFLKALYGLELDADELPIFREFTGRTTPRPGGYGEAVAIVGRQSGKSQIAAMIADFEALRSERAEGRGTFAVLVAQDARAAIRTLFGYAADPFDSPMLSAGVVSRLQDSITLGNGVTIACYPCRPAAVRGLRARVVVVDELAFFTSTDGRPLDTEMLRAVRPCLATTGGKLIVLSSPYVQTGVLFDLHSRHYGKDDSPTLIWRGSAPAMNSLLTEDYLSRQEELDPEAYRSEFMAEFRSGTTTFFDSATLDACVADRGELLPAAALQYFAFVDPSGGKEDAFTMAIAHHDGKRVVIDAVRAWPAPFNPTGVVAEAAVFGKSYRCLRVVGDRYGGEWPAEAFRIHGIEYTVSDLDRSALYLELLPLVNSGTIELPDDAKLLRELRGLERRRGSSGRDRVDHRPREHDDRANAVAGVAHLVVAVPEEKPRAGFGWRRPEAEEIAGMKGLSQAEKSEFVRAIRVARSSEGRREILKIARETALGQRGPTFYR
jgi:hypothetical protein